jgi:hypothetical protein
VEERSYCFNSIIALVDDGGLILHNWLPATHVRALRSYDTYRSSSTPAFQNHVPSSAGLEFSLSIAAMEEGEVLEEGELSDFEVADVVDTRTDPQDARHFPTSYSPDRSVEPPFKRRRRFDDEPGSSPSQLLSSSILSPSHSLSRNGVEVMQSPPVVEDVSRSPATHKEAQRRKKIHEELAVLYKAYSKVKQAAIRCAGGKKGKLTKEAEGALKVVADATKGAAFDQACSSRVLTTRQTLKLPELLCGGFCSLKLDGSMLPFFSVFEKSPADLAVDDITSLKEECTVWLTKTLNWTKGALLCFQQVCSNTARVLHVATA